MPGINQSWYAYNEAIDYPIDESASCVDTKGNRLPTDVIVDLKLRYPNNHGSYPFLASLSVTARVVSLTIESSDALVDPSRFSPLAVLAVPLPVVEGRQYALGGQIDGFGGWVVFGSGANDTQRPLAMRFAGPRQSLLTARAARAYRAIPVRGIRELASGNFITGIVRLSTESPLEAVALDREIDGVLRKVIVLRLTQADSDGIAKTDLAKRLSQTVNSEENVFQIFSGPCANRPESRTCPDPEPVEFVNAVSPDCNGVLTLEFRGCAVIAQTDDPCGAVIDCGTGLAQVCTAVHIPDSDGLLPSEVPPIYPPPIKPPVVPPTDDGESVVVIGELPYTECFDSFTALDWVVKSGSWGFVSEDSPGEDLYCTPALLSLSDSVVAPDNPKVSYRTISGASRAVSVWDGFDDTTLGRRVISDVKIMSGTAGTLHNASVVLNYREHQSIPGRFVYYTIAIDFDTQEFRISRFNGTADSTAVAVTVPGILTDTWYRITATVVPAVGNNIAITAHLRSMGSIDVTLGPLLVSNYAPSTGRNGLGANRSLVRFAFFRQEIVL